MSFLIIIPTRAPSGLSIFLLNPGDEYLASSLFLTVSGDSCASSPLVLRRITTPILPSSSERRRRRLTDRPRRCSSTPCHGPAGVLAVLLQHISSDIATPPRHSLRQAASQPFLTLQVKFVRHASPMISRSEHSEPIKTIAWTSPTRLPPTTNMLSLLHPLFSFPVSLLVLSYPTVTTSYGGNHSQDHLTMRRHSHNIASKTATRTAWRRY